MLEELQRQTRKDLLWPEYSEVKNIQHCCSSCRLKSEAFLVMSGKFPAVQTGSRSVTSTWSEPVKRGNQDVKWLKLMYWGRGSCWGSPGWGGGSQQSFWTALWPAEAPSSEPLKQHVTMLSKGQHQPLFSWVSSGSPVCAGPLSAAQWFWLSWIWTPSKQKCVPLSTQSLLINSGGPAVFFFIYRLSTLSCLVFEVGWPHIYRHQKAQWKLMDVLFYNYTSITQKLIVSVKTIIQITFQLCSDWTLDGAGWGYCCLERVNINLLVMKTLSY